MRAGEPSGRRCSPRSRSSSRSATPRPGHRVTRRHWLLIGGCVALAPLVLLINSDSLVGLTYLLPVALLVTATLPITLAADSPPEARDVRDGARRALHLRPARPALRVRLSRRRRARAGRSSRRPVPHGQSEYLYFSFVTLTTLGFGDLSPDVGLPQALTVFEALTGQVFLVTMVARLVTLWGRQGALGDERSTL